MEKTILIICMVLLLIPLGHSTPQIIQAEVIEDNVNIFRSNWNISCDILCPGQLYTPTRVNMWLKYVWNEIYGDKE